MPIRIEFFGIARQRAGIESIDVDASTLGEALTAAADRLPEFGRACVRGTRLQPAFIANINGELFTTDPTTPLGPGDAVLILSADAGG
jgi:molybdopterin converting factor small subunit